MSTSPLSPEEIRAAAEVHRELGPEYDDAVVAAFLAKVDREVAARVEARLAGLAAAAPLPPAPAPAPARAPAAAGEDSRMLLKGMAIGAAVSGTCLLAAMSGRPDEGSQRLLLVLLVWLALAAGYAVSASRARHQPASRRDATGR